MALDGPYGSLHIDLSSYSQLVLIAGGIGITPIVNILERLHALNSSSLELYAVLLRHFFAAPHMAALASTCGASPVGLLGPAGAVPALQEKKVS